MESLTNHYRSVKDDFLNTHYYSHYNIKHGKVIEVKDKEKALEMVRRYVEKLQMKQRVQAMHPTIGIDMEEVEEREERWATHANIDEKLDEFLHDKAPVNCKELLIEAYEAINTVERVAEKGLLNQARDKEY